MAVIGIDLGTTYSAAGLCVDGRPEIIHLEGDATLPSVVGVQRNGKIAVGKIAKRNQVRFPQDTIVEIKRKMGDKVQVPLGEKTFSPQEISAMILKKIKDLAEAELGEPVTGAVISCPALEDPQRQATREAAVIAGLEVLQIINEPTAAAYAYGVTHGNDNVEKLLLVYDLGGGTFDVTVIRMVAGTLDVLGTGGDPQLGGGNFDDRIVGWILDHLSVTHPEYVATLTDEKRAALRLRLKSYAEEGKIALCNSQAEAPSYQFNIPQVDQFQGKPIVFTETLTMTAFEGLIQDLLDNSLQWVDEALLVPREKHSYSESDLTAILLVGGSTRVPLVRKCLETRFPNTEIRGREVGINPDEIVALGASIAAADKDPESDEVSSTILVDVTGHTLSVEVFDQERNRAILAPIIPKETQIPCSEAHEFMSHGEMQTACRVKVYQGEGIEIDPDKVTMIGDFMIEIAPIMEPTPLRVGLDLDENGILVAHATDLLQGQMVRCSINYEDTSQITPAELEAKKKQFSAQYQAVVGQTANPLDGAVWDAHGELKTTGRPAQNAWAPTAGAGPVADVTAVMNPILRSLYNKAVNGFGQIPTDRQAEVLQLVMEIENAAQAGDQQRLMGYTPQLSKLLEGVP